MIIIIITTVIMIMMIIIIIIIIMMIIVIVLIMRMILMIMINNCNTQGLGCDGGPRGGARRSRADRAGIHRDDRGAPARVIISYHYY